MGLLGQATITPHLQFAYPRVGLDGTHCADYGKSRQLAEVRFVPNSGRIVGIAELPLCAISRH
jgi:hypothetical protein